VEGGGWRVEGTGKGGSTVLNAPVARAVGFGLESWPVGCEE